MLTVSVMNALFNEPVGLYPQEAHTMNKIQVDLRVSVPADIQQLPLIDYTVLYSLLKEVMQQPHKTLETIVRDVYAKIKGLQDESKVSISVRKLNPPISGIVDYMEVSFSD
jgi:dihydroneopterin aldolase